LKPHTDWQEDSAFQVFNRRFFFFFGAVFSVTLALPSFFRADQAKLSLNVAGRFVQKAILHSAPDVMKYCINVSNLPSSGTVAVFDHLPKVDNEK